MLTLLILLLIFTVSVVIHELAHFANARSVGVHVRAFSVGMGPVLLRKKWRGTEWRLSLLPIGGYVDLPGMAAEPDENGKLRSPTTGLAKKNLGQKLWVLVGGVIANFILAVLLLAVVDTADPVYHITIAQLNVPATDHIVQVSPGSAAEALGLKGGDLIVKADDVNHPTPEELGKVIGRNGPLTLTVKRGDETLTFHTYWAPKPNPDGSRPIFGISSNLAPLTLPPAVGFPRALLESTTFLGGVIPATVGGFFKAFGKTFIGEQAKDVAGPVGIYRLVHQASQVGFLSVLFLAGVLNFSLAVLNLLPIPGLDGGHMLLSVIKAVRGRPFKPGQEELISFLGIAAIMLFMLLITVNEVRGLSG
jgi:regulator of sigma E protease